MSRDFILDLSKKGIPETVGSKARNLRKLYVHGYPIPGTYVCVWEAHKQYISENPNILEEIKQELTRKLDNHKIYSVRSSANIEDNIDHLFAGQFKSFLNVQGEKSLLRAMEEIWQTADSPEIKSYMDMAEVSEHDLLMAIVLQEMISPVVSVPGACKLLYDRR